MLLIRKLPQKKKKKKKKKKKICLTKKQLTIFY